VKLAVLGLEKS